MAPSHFVIWFLQEISGFKVYENLFDRAAGHCIRQLGPGAGGPGRSRNFHFMATE